MRWRYDAAPSEVEIEQPPVEIEATLSPWEQQTDKTVEEPASVMATTTTSTTSTTTTCHSQKIENNERIEIVTTAHECERCKYENRDDIPISGLSSVFFYVFSNQTITIVFEGDKYKSKE